MNKIQVNRSNLRKRKQINYYEQDEPNFDEFIYCEHCYDFVYEYCSIHGPLLIIPDKKVTSRKGIPPWVPHAALTTPRDFVHIAPSIIPGAGLGVFSTVTLPRGVRFGPYRGITADDVTSFYCWQIQLKTRLTVVDGLDTNASNWMRYVNCARNWGEQNLVAFQYKGQIYYRTVKIIPKFTELLVFYGSEFAHMLGIDLRNYNKSPTLKIGKYIVEDVNATNTEIVNKDQDQICKTETLTVCEATPIINEEDTENSEAYEEEETVEQMTDVSTLDSEIGIDTSQSVDFTNIQATNDQHQISNTLQSVFPNHQASHDNNKDTTIKKEILECDVCNKTYKNPDSLRNHKYLHYQEPRYKCMQCPYKTNLPYRFNQHMDRHNKDKIFRCELCSYVGHVKNDFAKHLRRHRDK